ncbi:MAG: response regulator, partial [Dehalococcoidia bacterium]
ATLKSQMFSHKEINMTKEAVMAVLTRVAESDQEFHSRLSQNPAEALKEYNLTSEEHAALASGDIAKIEEWLGELDKKTSTWLKCRLEQEQWH